MLRRITFVIFLINILFSLHAAEVPLTMAKTVAENFIKKQVRSEENLKGMSLTLNLSKEIKMKNCSKAALYIFDISNSGFVIISGDDNVYPVLGFSLTNTLDVNNLSPALAQWIDDYTEQISYEAAKDVKNNENARIWEAYKKNITADKSGKASQIQPLLLTTWNQDIYYNAYCPVDAAGSGGHVYAGCVATAFGQIMKYYNYPKQGIGSYSYNDWNYGIQSADFANTTYQWEAMPNSLGSYNDAVAELLYHCGVSVDMGYSATGSGAYSQDVVPALINYFGYNNALNIKDRNSYSDQQWENMLISNLDALMPIYYSAYSNNGGHAFDFDGYYKDTLGTHFHINWGWSGYGNGYYLVNNLASPGGSFDFGHQAIFNIIPDQNYPVYCSGMQTITETSGTFEDGSGIYQYLNNTNCSWLIDPAVNVENIKLTFDKFDTEANNDVVTVYDGDNISAPVLGTFSGSNISTTLTSTGKKMLITFNTNSSVQGQGWSASFSCTLPLYCNNMTLLTDSVGTISDGSGPYNYNSSTNCRWRIEPKNPGSITITFTEFDLQDTEDFFQIINISSPPYILLDSYTGSQLPSSKTYNASKLLIWFKSQNNPKSGWSLNYNTTIASVGNVNSLNNINIYPNPTNDAINIDIKRLNPDCIVKIFDLCGHLVFTSNISKTSNIINIRDLSKGIYLLELIFDNEIENSRIIKY